MTFYISFTSATTATATANRALLVQVLPKDAAIYQITAATGCCQLTPLPGTPSRCLQFLDPGVRAWIKSFVWSPRSYDLTDVCAQMDLPQLYCAVENAIMNMRACTGAFHVTSEGQHYIMENSNVAG